MRLVLGTIFKKAEQTLGLFLYLPIRGPRSSSSTRIPALPSILAHPCAWSWAPYLRRPSKCSAFLCLPTRGPRPSSSSRIHALSSILAHPCAWSWAPYLRRPSKCSAFLCLPTRGPRSSSSPRVHALSSILAHPYTGSSSRIRALPRIHGRKRSLSASYTRSFLSLKTRKLWPFLPKYRDFSTVDELGAMML